MAHVKNVNCTLRQLKAESYSVLFFLSLEIAI